MKVATILFLIGSFLTGAFAQTEEDVANGWGVGGFDGVNPSAVYGDTNSTDIIPKRSLTTTGEIGMDVSYTENFNLGSLDIYNANMREEIRQLKREYDQAWLPMPSYSRNMQKTGLSGSDEAVVDYTIFLCSGGARNVFRFRVDSSVEVGNYTGPAGEVAVVMPSGVNGCLSPAGGNISGSTVAQNVDPLVSGYSIPVTYYVTYEGADILNGYNIDTGAFTRDMQLQISFSPSNL